jgi:hypothetical protein
LGIYRRPSGVYRLNLVVNGKQILTFCGNHNEKSAQKILSIRLAEIAEGRFSLPRSNRPTLEAWLREIVDAVPNPNSRRRYSTSPDNLISFFRRAKIPQVSVERIEAFKRARRLSGVKAATVNRDLLLLRAALKRAARQRLIGQNPFDAVDFLEERQERCIASVP